MSNGLPDFDALLSGKHGLSGVVGAIKQIAAEAFQQQISGFSVNGGNDMESYGYGPHWIVRPKAQPFRIRNQQPSAGYPWIGSASNGDSPASYNVWFGSDEGDASFVTKAASPVSAFQFNVAKSGGSSLTWTIGDDSPGTNDGLWLSGNGNEVEIQWFDSPQIVLSDSGGNSASFNINDGPEVYLYDGSNSISVDINDTPQVVLSDSDGNSASLNINDGPELYLYDGTNSISIDINVDPKISINDDDFTSQSINVCHLGAPATRKGLFTDPA